MPLYHCNKCHHEFEGKEAICDWCGAEGYILKKETELEIFLKWLQKNKKHDILS